MATKHNLIHGKYCTNSKLVAHDDIHVFKYNDIGISKRVNSIMHQGEGGNADLNRQPFTSIHE